MSYKTSANAADSMLSASQHDVVIYGERDMSIKGIFGAHSGFNFDILKKRFQGINSKDAPSVIPPTIRQNSKTDLQANDLAKQYFTTKSATPTNPTAPIAKALPVNTETATLPPTDSVDKGITPAGIQTINDPGPDQITFAGIVTINEPAPPPTDNVQKLPPTTDDGGLEFAGIITLNSSSETLAPPKSIQKYDSSEVSTLSTLKNRIA